MMSVFEEQQRLMNLRSRWDTKNLGKAGPGFATRTWSMPDNAELQRVQAWGGLAEKILSLPFSLPLLMKIRLPSTASRNTLYLSGGSGQYLFSLWGVCRTLCSGVNYLPLARRTGSVNTRRYGYTRANLNFRVFDFFARVHLNSRDCSRRFQYVIPCQREEWARGIPLNVIPHHKTHLSHINRSRCGKQETQRPRIFRKIFVNFWMWFPFSQMRVNFPWS